MLCWKETSQFGVALKIARLKSSCLIGKENIFLNTHLEYVTTLFMIIKIHIVTCKKILEVTWQLHTVLHNLTTKRIWIKFNHKHKHQLGECLSQVSKRRDKISQLKWPSKQLGQASATYFLVPLILNGSHKMQVLIFL